MIAQDLADLVASGKRYGAILCDAPWSWRSWNDKGKNRSPDWRPMKGAAPRHYDTMSVAEIAALPVEQLTAKDCMLFMWATWPTLLDALHVIERWGFSYRTCGFLWAKQNPQRHRLAPRPRANSKPCLLAVRGKPKRLSAAVRQFVVAPTRAH